MQQMIEESEDYNTKPKYEYRKQDQMCFECMLEFDEQIFVVFIRLFMDD